MTFTYKLLLCLPIFLIVHFLTPLDYPEIIWGEDIVLSEGLKTMYDPEMGHYRLIPGNYREVFDPEKGTYALMPDHYVAKYDPEHGQYKLVPKNYEMKFDPESGRELLAPKDYERKYDPETGSYTTSSPNSNSSGGTTTVGSR